MGLLLDRTLRQKFLPFYWNPNNTLNSKTDEEIKDEEEKVTQPEKGTVEEPFDEAEFERTASPDEIAEYQNNQKYGVGGTVDTPPTIVDYAEPNIFTFKNLDETYTLDNVCKLHIMPAQNSFLQNDDIGLKQHIYKQVFGSEAKEITTTTTINDILEKIPAIQIREFTQDIRLDLVLSLVEYFKEGFETGKKLTTEQTKMFFDKLIYDFKDIKNSKILESLLDGLKDTLVGGTTIHSESWDEKIILNLCYNLYYRMITTSTTNIYVLPCNTQELLNGNGFEGYANGWSLDTGNILSKFLGAMGSFIAPNVSLTLTPIWQGLKGGGEGVNLEMTVSLFNDTIDAALANFIFVNTLIPQNLPLQYAILQQPPSLYDIKIEGFNRLFMCAGNFNVSYKGVMRVPSKNFLDKLKTHTNKKIIKELNKMIFNNQLRIPDVYEIKMNFKSLLPNTFNNFLFQFAANNNIYLDKKITQPSLIAVDKTSAIIDSWINGNVEAAKKEEPTTGKGQIKTAQRPETQAEKEAKEDERDLGIENRYVQDVPKQADTTPLAPADSSSFDDMANDMLEETE